MFWNTKSVSLIFIVSLMCLFTFSLGLVFRIWVPFKEDHKSLQLEGRTHPCVTEDAQAGHQKYPLRPLGHSICAPAPPWGHENPQEKGWLAPRLLHVFGSEDCWSPTRQQACAPRNSGTRWGVAGAQDQSSEHLIYHKGERLCTPVVSLGNTGFILVKVVKLYAVYRWVCVFETKAGHSIYLDCVCNWDKYHPFSCPQNPWFKKIYIFC